MYTSGWPKEPERGAGNRVRGRPPPAGSKKCGAEVAVGQQHGDGAGQHRQGEQQQEGRHQDRPGEQRHAVERHARRAHVEDRGDEVDGAQGSTRRRRGAARRWRGPCPHPAARRAARRSSSRCRRPPPMTADNSSSRKAGGSSQKLMLFMRGNAMFGRAADHQRPRTSCRNPPISAGMTTKNTMVRPCAVTMVFHRWPLGVAVRAVEVLNARLQQLEPYDDREGGARSGRR